MTRAELEANREAIEEAFDEAKRLQQEYWDALTDLETALGYVEMNGTEELSMSVDDLIDLYAGDEEDEDAD